jgi:hypothetical protein
MTMHLLSPAYNNFGNNKKKPTAKQFRAKQEHEKFLKKMNIHPDQLSARRQAPHKLQHSVHAVSNGLDCSNGFDVGGFKKSVFDSDWKNAYEDDPQMAAREQAAIQDARAKSKRIAPAYNKGAYQYITLESNLSDIGKKK